MERTSQRISHCWVTWSQGRSIRNWRTFLELTSSSSCPQELEWFPSKMKSRQKEGWQWSSCSMRPLSVPCTSEPRSSSRDIKPLSSWTNLPMLTRSFSSWRFSTRCSWQWDNEACSSTELWARELVHPCILNTRPASSKLDQLFCLIPLMWHQHLVWSNRRG